MKNLDPKVVIPAVIVILVLCLAVILKSVGVGKDNTPPPIASGGPPPAPGAAGGSGAPPPMSTTLPGMDEAKSKAAPMPNMGGAPGMGR